MLNWQGLSYIISGPKPNISYCIFAQFYLQYSNNMFVTIGKDQSIANKHSLLNCLDPNDILIVDGLYLHRTRKITFIYGQILVP